MMTRWMAIAGCALALAVAAPLGNQAEADGMVTRRPVFKHKRCIAPTMWLWRTGTGQTTWVCAAAEKCCYDRLLRKGTCIAANARCF
jgi:hypothetical protein